MTNIEMVEAELANAKRKHPHFIDHFTSVTAEEAGLCLDGLRAFLRTRVTFGEVAFQSVLMCEVLESIEAYTHGNFAHARQELAQCAAVCIRGMEFIEAEANEKGVAL